MTPSEQLARFIRETASKRGLNTAALANEAGVPRSELKQVLAGSATLTVDMLVAVAAALELGPEDLDVLGNSTELPTIQPEAGLAPIREPTALTD